MNLTRSLRHLTTTLTCALLLSSSVAHSGPNDDDSTENADKLRSLVSGGLTGDLVPSRSKITYAAGVNAFGFDLLGQLPADENIVYSPYSVYETLALTHLAARGETAKESAKLLRADEFDDFHQTMGRLGGVLRSRGRSNGSSATFDPPESSLAGEGGQLIVSKPDANNTSEEQNKQRAMQLHIANDLWLHEAFEPSTSFLRQAKLYYRSKATVVDMGKPKQTARRINRRIEQVTQNKISSLIDPETLSSTTPLVQTNAVYFFGRWEHVFNERKTKDAEFTLTNGKTKKVKMMQQQRTFAYAELPELKAKAVELPYDGGPVSAIAILPTSGTLAELEGSLDEKSFQKLLKGLSKANVDVKLPKFELRDSFATKGYLQALGLDKMYNPSQADLSGIQKKGKLPLYVADDVHAAVIEVNERQTVAAAATAQTKGFGAVDIKPARKVTFHANRPFLFLVVDKPTGTVLFVARVLDPTEQ